MKDLSNLVALKLDKTNLEKDTLALNGKEYTVIVERDQDYVTFPDDSRTLETVIDLQIKENDEIIYENCSARGYVFYEDIKNQELTNQLLEMML